MALNGMVTKQPQMGLGCGKGGKRSLSQAQCSVFSHVKQCVDALGRPPVDLSPAEALRQLRVGPRYPSFAGGPGSYLSAEVSLPSAGNGAVPLSELWGPGGVSEVDDFVKKNLLRREMVDDKKNECGLRAPYNDPELLRGTRYAHFVKELAARGIVEYVDAEEVVETVGLFFVEKKNKKLRLICDCRLSNLWFTDPDH
eukprot:9422141-Karenia_brevis.AAC.1